jgi:hypothetical protein
LSDKAKFLKENIIALVVICGIFKVLSPSLPFQEALASDVFPPLFPLLVVAALLVIVLDLVLTVSQPAIEAPWPA